ncbi:hypothetical protein AM1BK_02760 [Neobacillus kokaensis]|uniref:Uncharacterized protein n=1 Tax=Neobacillus kokaensis TaxID=2759023 RepID=A0ABQ3MY96_9BACI|nr:hypothetical protein AM1BK_02760 [Neobacillus kokaensis]
MSGTNKFRRLKARYYYLFCNISPCNNSIFDRDTFLHTWVKIWNEKWLLLQFEMLDKLDIYEKKRSLGGITVKGQG